MRKCCCQQSYGGLLWFECVLKPLYVKFNFKVSLLLGNKIIFHSIVDVSFVFVIIIIYIIIEMKFLQSFTALSKCFYFCSKSMKDYLVSYVALLLFCFAEFGVRTSYTLFSYL